MRESHLRPWSAGLLALAIGALASAAGAGGGRFDDCVEPYVRSNNFAGVVLVSRGDRTLFSKAYGSADLERGTPNTLATRFHIASLSAQFTAVATMRLVEQGRLDLATPVRAYAPDVPNAEKITIAHLLEQTSGLPDINNLPEYAQILEEHQTPDSLVRRIVGKPPGREPGGEYQREEHSAWNLLALIVERTTGRSFAAAVRDLVFDPLEMHDSGIDDDSVARAMARGYAPQGLRDLVPAQSIHWSAKSGNGSAFVSGEDELKWVRAFLSDRLLKAASRATMLDTTHVGGYGWFKAFNPRLGAPTVYMSGRAPGFASFVASIPSESLTVIVLSNVYSSVTTTIGLDLLAVARGGAFTPLRLRDAPLALDDLRGIAGTYSFGPTFYQPNATLALRVGHDVELAWPSGSISTLIPVARDTFVDRGYWVPVALHRDAAGKVTELMYGTYRGSPAPSTGR